MRQPRHNKVTAVPAAKTWIKISFTLLFTAFTLFLVYTVLFAGKTAPGTVKGYFKETFPYDLEHPVKKLFLPVELTEISGIVYREGTSLLAIEDEHGIIYVLDYTTGRITARYAFGNDGDYEDITIVEDTVYVLRNSGKIYRIINLGENVEMNKKFKPELDLAKNTEGLCYYEKRNILLLAYKSVAAAETGARADLKPIFAFDPVQEIFLPDPVFNLDFIQIGKISGMKISSVTFKPSGIAIHPLTGHIYIISSIAKQLLAIDAEGNLVFLAALNTLTFKQPEGICFLPGGDMLISSEGRGGNGYLLHFAYKPAGS